MLYASEAHGRMFPGDLVTKCIEEVDKYETTPVCQGGGGRYEKKKKFDKGSGQTDHNNKPKDRAQPFQSAGRRKSRGKKQSFQKSAQGGFNQKKQNNAKGGGNSNRGGGAGGHQSNRQ